LLSPSPSSDDSLDEVLAKIALKTAASKRKRDSGPEAAAKFAPNPLAKSMIRLIEGVAGYQKNEGEAIPKVDERSTRKGLRRESAALERLLADSRKGLEAAKSSDDRSAEGGGDDEIKEESDEESKKLDDIEHETYEEGESSDKSKSSSEESESSDEDSDD
jgi:hypothetical protein